MAQVGKIELPPAANDVEFTFTVRKEAVPLLLEWFNDTKRGAETAQQFVLRNLVLMALQHRRGKVASTFSQEHRDEEVTENEKLNNEFTDLAGRL